jgi:hypothetical protein
MQYLALGMRDECSEPKVCARVSFWEAFGITPDLQIALEKAFSQVSLNWDKPSHTLEFGNLIAGLC